MCVRQFSGGDCFRVVIICGSTRYYGMPLLTKSQLATELGLKVPGIESLTRKKKIPVLKISHRCVRYDLAKVMAALEKFEVKEVL